MFGAGLVGKMGGIVGFEGVISTTRKKYFVLQQTHKRRARSWLSVLMIHSLAIHVIIIPTTPSIISKGSKKSPPKNSVDLDPLLDTSSPLTHKSLTIASHPTTNYLQPIHQSPTHNPHNSPTSPAPQIFLLKTRFHLAYISFRVPRALRSRTHGLGYLIFGFWLLRRGFCCLRG